MKSVGSGHVLALNDLTEMFLKRLTVIAVHINDLVVELYRGVCRF